MHLGKDLKKKYLNWTLMDKQGLVHVDRERVLGGGGEERNKILGAVLARGWGLWQGRDEGTNRKVG